jgi:hypothetical protein
MVTAYAAVTGKWKIAVYGRDHGVPHFHVVGPDFDCAVSIAELRPIVGRAPRTILAAALAWAAQPAHRAALLKL